MATSNEIVRKLLDEKGSPINWNWEDDFVDSDTTPASCGSYLGGDCTLVCVGPPIAIGSFNVKKLGAAPSIQLSSQAPQSVVAEIGSKRVHVIQGTPRGGGSIQRFLFNKGTLLKECYRYLFDANGNLTEMGKTGLGTDDVTMWNNMINKSSRISKTHNTSNLWLSLWDDKLKFPVGFAIYFQDQTGKDAGAVYLEGVKFNSHSFSVQSSQLLMAESLNFSYDRMVPVASTGIVTRK